MSISAVKKNMYQSYSSCTQLENNLSQLINILRSVDDSNAYIVSQYISTVKYTMNTVKRNFDKMLHLNRVELHIFFREFNSKTSNTIYKLNTLSNELNSLSLKANELYTLYKLAKSMEFFLKYFLNANSLRRFIPNISRTKNDLQVFKRMIDDHNKKLITGVRR